MIKSKCYEITKENILGHEMIGLKLNVIKSTDPKRIGVKGIVVDETQNTFIIIQNGKEQTLPKKECVFEFDLNGEKVIVEGKKILRRSEDRTKEFRNWCLKKGEWKMAEKKSKEAKIKTKDTAVVVESTPTEEKKFIIRGNIYFGKVVSAKANKTVTVEREITQYLPKYERYKKSKSKVHAHNPNNMAKEGDLVKIGETRRISKTKSFVVMEIVGKDKQW